MIDLRDELRELGRGMTAVPSDDLADVVLARVGAPVGRTRTWRRWVAALAALIAAIAVSAAVSAPVRAAISHVFRFGGVEVHHGQGPAPVPSPTLPGEHPTDVAAAERQVRFTVRTPAALGLPTSITVSERRVVTLRYSSASGPVQIDEFNGSLGPMWDKYMMAGDAQRVDVNGHDGLWFPQPVTLVYVLPNGSQDPRSARLTNGTLVWIDGAITYRMDGIQPLRAALDVARGMS
jgi:hypothetical protein